MNHLTPDQTVELRRMLVSEKEDLEHRMKMNDHFGLSLSLGENLELSTYDNHPADIATEVYERGKDLALQEHADLQLEETKQALERMKDGTYGLCIVCGNEIPYERLTAIPTTAYCKEHVPDPHRSERRPVEEQILAPPFGRTSLDEHPEQNQFDGEDAWQIVESWGNSDSPAMAENPKIDSYNEMFVEADENEGFVEPIESFVATDLYGNEVYIVRNRQYKEYMDSDEGYHFFEPDPKIDEDDAKN